MNLLLREKKDGRRAPGYLVYLGAGLLAIGGVLWLRRDAAPQAAPAPRRRIGSVATVTQSAAMMAPIQHPPAAPGAGAISFRIPASAAAEAKTEPVPTAADDPFDTIHAALTAAPPPPAGAATLPARPLEDDTAEPAERSDSGYARLPPAYAAAPGHGGGAATVKPERGQLLGYRDESADPPAAAAEAPPPEPELHPAALMPRGTLICVDLLTTVDSSNPAAVIQFGVARTVVFNHRRQLAFGTRFLGRLAGHPVRDRLNLTADTVLFPDGREWPVLASAVEADPLGANIRPGVGAAYFPPPPWAQVAPYVSDLFTGFMGLLQSRAQSPFALGVGGVSLQTGGASAVRAPLYQASGQAIQDYTQSRLREIEQRYASYYLIPAGTECWLQIDSDLVLGPAAGEHSPVHPSSAAALPLSPGPASHVTDLSP